MPVTLHDPGQLDGEALYFVDQYKNNVHCAVFGQALVSHQVAGQWWQYAAWYGADRTVRVARQDPTGVWELVALPITLAVNDSHNTIALGVSTVDGRLHLAAGGHNSPMAYSRTAAAGLTGAWHAGLWETPSDTLAGEAIGNMTYPTFTATPAGNLLFWYRNGGSSNGRLRLADYDGTGWTLLGDVTSSTGSFVAWNGGQSTSRGFYWVPPQYDDAGALHLFGTWRENNPAVLCAPTSPIANHHVVWMRSFDDGRTWINGAGGQVAETGVDPLSVVDTSVLVDTGTDTRYALQVFSMAFGPCGLVGYLANYVRGNIAGGCVNDDAERVARAGEHLRWRDPATGLWSNSTVVVGGQNVFCQWPTGRAGRGHLVFGPSGDAHVFYAGFRVYSATRVSGYSDWTATGDWSGRLQPFGEAHQPDRSRESEGRVSFLYGEQGAAGATTAPVCVRDFLLEA